jgi:hypothetical protein
MSKLLQRQTAVRSGDNRDQRTPAFLFNRASVNWSGLARIVHSDHSILVVIPGVHEKGMALPALRRYIHNSQLQLNLML